MIHITVFALPDPADSAAANRATVASLKKFRERFATIFAERYRDTYKAHPDTYGRHNWDRVAIELHQSSGLELAGVNSDLLAIAGGTAPDVLYVNFVYSETYIRNGLLYPLDDYFSSLAPIDVAWRVHESVWPVIRRKGPGGRKHIWALPYGGALGKVLLYRKDLFDAHNIAYPTASWTWDDMLSACRKIADPDRGVYGTLLYGGGWWWLTWLWSAGGDVMQYDEATDQWRCVFNSPEAALALDQYAKLACEKWVDHTGKIHRGYSTLESKDNIDQKWERGEIGMLIAYIDAKTFAAINPEETGMAPVPLGPTGRRGSEINNTMMGMFAGIKDPAVRDAAWEYMRWPDSDAALAVTTRVMVEGGLGPFINPKLLRRFGYGDVEQLAPKEWARDYEIAIASGKPEPYGPNSAMIYRMMGYPVDEVLYRAANDKLPADPKERLGVIQGILGKAADRANEEMIGIISPRERLLRRILAGTLLVAIVGAFAGVFRKVLRTFTLPQRVQAPTRKGHLRRYAWAYLLLLPAVLTVAIWQYVPLFRGSVMAFQDYKLLGGSTWVGLDNFGNLLFDNLWWLSIWNSLRYSMLVIALTFLPPVVLAIALQEVPRGTLAYRLLFYLPAILSGIVTVLLWQQFFQPSERGALNALVMHIPAFGFILIGLALFAGCLAFSSRLWRLDKNLAAWGFLIVGVVLALTCAALSCPILFPPTESLDAILARLPQRLFACTPEPYRWLHNPQTAMLACVIPMVWAGVGPGCLIYLAALKGIPNDYYEAADIDGAGFIEKVLFVVFPMLKALILINFVGTFIGAWYGAMGNILVMTGGSANTEVADLHIWYQAFGALKFGPATAMAWMLGFMLIGFTVYQLRILARVEFKAQGTGPR